MAGEKHSWTTNPVPHFGNSEPYRRPEDAERAEYERLKAKFDDEIEEN